MLNRGQKIKTNKILHIHLKGGNTTTGRRKKREQENVFSWSAKTAICDDLQKPNVNKYFLT